MNICAIIPCHHGKFVQQIAAKLHMQHVEHIIVVLDRIENIEFNDALGVTVLRNDDGTGFCAGKCRDIAIDYILMNKDIYGECPILFIDEDCIPQDNLVADHYKLLQHEIPVISCGRRLEQKYAWNDLREMGEMSNLNLFSKSGAVVQNPGLIKQCQVTWTCNMGINYSALKKIRHVMNKYYNVNRIFHPDFDGAWGGEDSFLGYVAWSAKVFMNFVPRGSNGVKHMDHPRPSNIYNKQFSEKLKAKVDDLSRKLVTNPLTLDDYDY